MEGPRAVSCISYIKNQYQAPSRVGSIYNSAGVEFRHIFQVRKSVGSKRSEGLNFSDGDRMEDDEKSNERQAFRGQQHMYPPGLRQI